MQLAAKAGRVFGDESQLITESAAFAELLSLVLAALDARLLTIEVGHAVDRLYGGLRSWRLGSGTAATLCDSAGELSTKRNDALSATV